MLVHELDLIKFRVRLYTFLYREREEKKKKIGEREREKPCGKAKDLSQRQMVVSYAYTSFCSIFRSISFRFVVFLSVSSETFSLKFLNFVFSALVILASVRILVLIAYLPFYGSATVTFFCRGWGKLVILLWIWTGLSSSWDFIAFVRLKRVFWCRVFVKKMDLGFHFPA